MPSSSSSRVRRIRRSRVFCCLASSTQQMNSLRASGVMSFHASSAMLLAVNASRRSTGSRCTTPPGTRVLLTAQRYRAGGHRRMAANPLVRAFSAIATAAFLADGLFVVCLVWVLSQSSIG